MERFALNPRCAFSRVRRKIEAAAAATVATLSRGKDGKDPFSEAPAPPPRGSSHPTPGGSGVTSAVSSHQESSHQECGTRCSPSPSGNCSCSPDHRTRSLPSPTDDHDHAITRSCRSLAVGDKASIIQESSLAQQPGDDNGSQKRQPILKVSLRHSKPLCNRVNDSKVWHRSDQCVLNYYYHPHRAPSLFNSFHRHIYARHSLSRSAQTQPGMMKALRFRMADLSKGGKKSSSILCRLVPRSARSKEGHLCGTKRETGSDDHDHVSTGVASADGISTEEDEDEASTGSNEEISLGTISTGNVSKDEDDASLDGSFISDGTLEEEEENQQQHVRPSTPFRGVSGFGQALRSRGSSLARRTLSCVKPLATVGATLSKKPRSAFNGAGRWFRGVKTSAGQRLASRKRKKERERAERQRERRRRKRERREERERERNKIFGRGWKRRLVIKLIVSMYPKGWKCRLGERIRTRISDLVTGHKRPYVPAREVDFRSRFFERRVRLIVPRRTFVFPSQQQCSDPVCVGPIQLTAGFY